MLAKWKHLFRWPSRRNFVLTVNWILFLGCICVVIFCNVWEQTVNLIEWHRSGRPALLKTTIIKKSIQSDHLIDTPGCVIWDMKPFDKSVSPHWKPSSMSKCPIPILAFENGLKYNSNLKDWNNADCCFREITRTSQSLDNHDWDADSLYSVNETCIPISHGSNEGLELPEFMLTECTVGNRSGTNETVKVFDYLAVPPSPWNSKTSLQAQQVAQYWEHRRKESSLGLQMPPNVLVIGVDSVSRLHFMRSLPLTREYVLANDFVELKGYTRVGLNTFPNLMAVLGGFEDDNYPCWGAEDSTFDSCPFIWDQFSANNYVTAFAEDFNYMSTFNFLKAGFVDPPTDYYFRPMGKAYRSDDFRPFKGCVNGGTELEFVWEYVKNLQRSIGGRVPYFLFSWMNQAHDDFNVLQNFDTVLRNAVQGAVESQGIEANNTIIVFMSDHGLRFGGFRETLLGYFEESLPFFFIRLPPAVKDKFPDWQRHLENNSGKLVSPLDLHKTFQHIVEYDSGLPAPLQTNSEVRQYYSLFEEVPDNRTCEDAGISIEYCRCGFRPVSSNKPVAAATANVVTSKLNSILDYEIGIGLCVSVRYRKLLYLRDLGEGQQSNGTSGEAASEKSFLIGFSTDPVGARFEATLGFFSAEEAPEVRGEIRRIDSYKGHSDCIDNVKKKNYCICRDYVENLELEVEGESLAENSSEIA